MIEVQKWVSWELGSRDAQSSMFLVRINIEAPRNDKPTSSSLGNKRSSKAGHAELSSIQRYPGPTPSSRTSLYHHSLPAHPISDHLSKDISSGSFAKCLLEQGNGRIYLRPFLKGRMRR